MGGDEAECRWLQAPDVKKRAKLLGIGSEHALLAHFHTRLSSITTKHGRQGVGWDEILLEGDPAGLCSLRGLCVLCVLCGAAGEQQASSRNETG